MENQDARILDKIKKCLALSGSSNPNEAAAALRQAHLLMSKHGVSAHEVTMSDIGEYPARSRTMARDKPAHWETRLASLVGKAFGCQIIFSHRSAAFKYGHLNQGQYIFVGLKQQVEVAAYTATVLMRKCKLARQQWVKETFAGRRVVYPGEKAKKTRMGDMFAEGWVLAIGQLVADFANPPEIDEAIQRHINSRADGIAETRGGIKNALTNGERAAAAMGMEAAEGERLYRPVDGAATPLALGVFA